ncbi:MAG: NUDIX hydrolase [Polaromonas sp.]|uniref:NUDIX domain-containing protein n=1 Tax=Burkholderiales TaxID=80840 RepID=UPI00248939FF|nr:MULTISPECIES: NUDIX hydrolase [Burkholderiales]MDI1258621.1 NUDIX hydrolase [Aquabacterium sp.]MDI1270959.1 NUDIX hydrolase [Polaromonas sp.]
MNQPTPAFNDDHLREETIESHQVYQGHFIDLRRDRVRLPNGREAGREYVVHPGAVMIVAILPDGGLVMERQYRYPVRQTMIEFPAGKLDGGEGGLACAQRELWEETGYRAKRWAKAGIMHPVIGYATEIIEIWFADDLTLGERHLDDGEFLDVFTATADELDVWMQQGLLTDAKTIVGMMWLKQWLAGVWPLDWQEIA